MRAFTLAGSLIAAGCGGRSQLVVPSPRIDASAPDAPTLRAVAIAAGGAHACARLSDGTTRCWGANESGQLGDGTTINSARPVTVLLPDGASRIAAGPHDSCGQAPGGAMFCWGRNDHGQLGDGTTQSRLQPSRLLLDGAVGMSLAEDHSMVAMADGRALVFGSDLDCALGDSTLSAVNPTPVALPAPIDGPGSVVRVAAGGAFSCAVFADGRLRCSGTLDPDGAEWCPPNNSGGLPPITDAAVGLRYLCALSNDGRVFCRGANDTGQLGDGTQIDREDWGPVALAMHATRIATGVAHTCARLADGSLWCWGRNDAAQLGRDDAMFETLPVSVALPESVDGVALGDAFSCALGTSGSVYCWGANEHGQLGDGTNTPRSAAETVAF